MNQSVLFGERLRELRAHAGLSQSEFAKIGGVTKKSQMLYESGERVPNALYPLALTRTDPPLLTGIDPLTLSMGISGCSGERVRRGQAI